MRVVGYVRVSTEEQARTGLSVESQTNKLKLYAEMMELELVDLIVDAGESAKSLDRPGARRALALLRARNGAGADGLLVAKLDRLTRSLKDWQALIDEFFGERGKKRLYSVGESIDTSTAAGRLVLNVLMTVAQWERETIAERTRDALAVKIARRELAGGVPFGFDALERAEGAGDDAPVPLAENDDEQRALGLMMEWRAAGVSYRKICEQLEYEGVRTKKGEKVWAAMTVKRVLDRALRIRQV